MKTIGVCFLFVLIFCGCKKENEFPNLSFEVKMDHQVFGNFLRFTLLSDPEISSSDLTFSIGNLEVFPEKTENGEWVLPLKGFPAGTHQLNVSQTSNPENNEISIFEKAAFLLELGIDPSLMEDQVRHHLVLWNEAGQTIWVEELAQAGEHRVDLGSYEFDTFSWGIFTEFDEYHQGLGQVFDGVSLGNFFPLGVTHQDHPRFGTATLKFQQIPTHQEYWIGSRGSFSHGQNLPPTLPLFLDLIPTRFFVRLKQEGKTYAQFFPERATFSGETIDLNLSAMNLMNSQSIRISKAISGSYSVYGFESVSDLTSQTPLEIGPLSGELKLNLINYASLFPKVEFQLNYAEDDFQIFSRFRAVQLPTYIQTFDADVSILNESKLLVKGTSDLLFTTWTGMDSKGTDWLIVRVQGPDQTRLLAPLIASEALHLENLSLNSITLEESDLLDNYSDFLSDFSLGKSRDYFQNSSRFHSKIKSLASARIQSKTSFPPSFSRYSIFQIH